MKIRLLYIILLMAAANAISAQDNWDFKVFEKNARTWRDSGYYFQIEFVDFRIQKLSLTPGGGGKMNVVFRSTDPSGQQYRGSAIFTLNSNSIPSDLTPSVGTLGKTSMTIAQDVLICPSPEQEVGLGQNDPFFPLYYSGFILQLDGKMLETSVPIAVELRDMEIIL